MRGTARCLRAHSRAGERNREETKKIIIAEVAGGASKSARREARRPVSRKGTRMPRASSAPVRDACDSCAGRPHPGRAVLQGCAAAADYGVYDVLSGLRRFKVGI